MSILGRLGTPFREPGDLPYFVIRDVLAKIRHRLSPPSIRTRQLALPEPRRLNRPIGMEFLTSADRGHFYGREAKLNELLQAIENNRIPSDCIFDLGALIHDEWALGDNLLLDLRAGQYEEVRAVRGFECDAAAVVERDCVFGSYSTEPRSMAPSSFRSSDEEREPK